MNLLKAYTEISSRIANVDFEMLWEGFRPSKFAVYSDREVCFNGEMMPKTEEFIANTSITFRGEDIAIWSLTEPYDADILASKMIHEMFHAFQRGFSGLVFPNEMQATLNYRYSAENLSAKHYENVLLSELSVEFDSAKFKEFCSVRKYRLKNSPYETQYEMSVEQIEGTANYVELSALKQISESKYQEKLAKMRGKILDINELFPVRIVSYDIGALLIKVIRDNKLDCRFAFDSNSFMTEILSNSLEYSEKIQNNSISRAVDDYCIQTQQMIASAVDKNDKISVENANLIGYNVYNARYCDGFVLSTFFVMYESDGKENILNGDFAVEITDDMKIKNLYRTELEL